MMEYHGEGGSIDSLGLVNQQLFQPSVLLLPPEIPCWLDGLTAKIQAYCASKWKMSLRARGNRGCNFFFAQKICQDFRLILDADSRLLTSPTLGKTVPNFHAWLRSVIQAYLEVEAIYCWLLNHVEKITGPIILIFLQVSRISIGKV